MHVDALLEQPEHQEHQRRAEREDQRPKAGKRGAQGEFHRARCAAAGSKLRDQRDAAEQQERAQAAPEVELVNFHPQEAEVVDGERHDERGRDVQRGVGARADLAHEFQPRINCHRADQPGQGCPPGHLLDVLTRRQRLGDDRNGADEEGGDQPEGN